MEFLTSWIAEHAKFIGDLFTAGGVGAALSLVLRKAFTLKKKEAFKKQIQDIADALAGVGTIAGLWVTVGLSKFKMTSKLWNIVFEPYVILIGDIIIESFLIRLISKFWMNFVKALKSDNPSYSDD